MCLFCFEFWIALTIRLVWAISFLFHKFSAAFLVGFVQLWKITYLLTVIKLPTGFIYFNSSYNKSCSGTANFTIKVTVTRNYLLQYHHLLLENIK